MPQVSPPKISLKSGNFNFTTCKGNIYGIQMWSTAIHRIKKRNKKKENFDDFGWGCATWIAPKNTLI